MPLQRERNPMNRTPSRDERDEKLLQQLLQLLAARGIAKKWAASETPRANLESECRLLISDPTYKEEFRSYLASNPIIQDTVETLISNLAMTTNANWRDTPQLVHQAARRGWHISRWLPTFLIIDGPLGRFLKSSDSPLNSLLKREYKKYPTLAQARDIFNHDLFRKVRNGFGHWAFRWEERVDGSHIVMMDWETGKPTVTITLLEAEALHLTAFATISALNEEVFTRINPIK